MSTRALVVGAGPAGLAAAAGLAAWCDAVTVIEAGPRRSRRSAGEHLPPAALSQLAELGFAGLLADPRHEASPGVRSAWGGDDVVDKEYFCTTPGRGLNLCREVFDEALAQHVERRGVTLRFRARLRSLAKSRDGYAASVLTLHGLQAMHADIVVDASGRSAVAARHLGAERRRCDRLLGMAGRIESCAPADECGRVHVEASDDGWWYAVPFSDGTLLACWMTDADGMRHDLRHDQRHDLRQDAGRVRDVWQQRLQRSRIVRALARGGRSCGRLDLFDAGTQWLACEASALHIGFLAVGDAAMAYDPLSSWGITKGLSDGSEGAAALARQHAGDAEAVPQLRARRWREFERCRARQLGFYRAERRWAASPFWHARQQEHRGSTP